MRDALYNRVRMWFVVWRARRAPSKFLERAAWRTRDEDAARVLYYAMCFVFDGREPRVDTWRQLWP